MSENVLLESVKVETTSPSTPPQPDQPNHVAIIMDGNRRWARARGLPTSCGHEAGLERAVAILKHIKNSSIQCVTLFAFASANWSRQREEVTALLKIAAVAVSRFTPLAMRERICVQFIGRRDRLPRKLQVAMRQTELVTAAGERVLRIAIDYSSQQQILRAARYLSARDELASFQRQLSTPVDLLIRTGGERRLSDFMLWEIAFAELYFCDTYWPDFDHQAYSEALDWFSQRQRRFGS